MAALPKMLWALWLDEDHRAAKMHLEFDILKGACLRVRTGRPLFVLRSLMLMQTKKLN